MIETEPDQSQLTPRYTAEAVEFITANKDNPWLLYLTHFSVHTPIQGKPELIAKYKKNPNTPVSVPT